MHAPTAHVPARTAWPSTSDEVQAIVREANRDRQGLVPVSSRAPHRRGASAPSMPGAVCVDLSRMDRILRIDRRNRIALIEPGVTFDTLVPALAGEGLRIAMPLVPKAGKSVIASLLEREPLVTPRFAWNALEPLRTVEVIWGNGERLSTGNGHMRGERDSDWEQGFVPLMAGGPGQLDFYRMLSGAQGAMGIVTWASVKLEPASERSTLLFLVADRLEDLVPCAYELVKVRFGDETFIVNANTMAMLSEGDASARNALAANLPRWLLVVGIGGGSIAGAQMLAAREADIREIAERHGVVVQESILGTSGPAMLTRLQAPSPEPYWREGPSGGTDEVFFLTTLDRACDFIETAEAALGGPDAASDMGVYLQPIHQGAGVHMELLLPRAGGPGRVATVARAVFEHGAYFSRPYGEWADWVFAADPATTALTRTVKGIFDPNNVMNPGKLCFPASAG